MNDIRLERTLVYFVIKIKKKNPIAVDDLNKSQMCSELSFKLKFSVRTTCYSQKYLHNTQ